MNEQLVKLVNAVNLLGDAKDIGTYAGRLASFFCAVENMIQMPSAAEPVSAPADAERLARHLKIKTEEHNCCAEDLRVLAAKANALLYQIDRGDFVDSHGHSAKTLKATIDLMDLLGR